MTDREVNLLTGVSVATLRLRRRVGPPTQAAHALAGTALCPDCGLPAREFPPRGTSRVVSKGKAYEYPRYQFSNRSDDIRRIFTNACDALGIEWRSWTRYHVSVAKRNAVAQLDAFVGPKG